MPYFIFQVLLNRRWKAPMAAISHTASGPGTFILVGLAGMERSPLWTSLPFFSMYIIALLGNFTLFFILSGQRSLPRLMYLFLSVSAVAELLLLTSTVHRTLAVFCVRVRDMSFSACLAQVLLVHFTFVAESAILLPTAFDWDIAICNLQRDTRLY